jgi:hypothetical protein
MSVSDRVLRLKAARSDDDILFGDALPLEPVDVAAARAHMTFEPAATIAHGHVARDAFAHPLAHFSHAECRAWIATLIALRAHPRRSRRPEDLVASLL